MASDLIPPPSPAGRPQPDGAPPPGGHPWLVELPADPVAATPAPAPAGAPPPHRHAPTRFRNRFGFLMGGLGGVVLAAAIVLTVILATGNGPKDYGLAPNWSAWTPQSDSINNGAPEIAAHVESEYRLDDGRQLVSVKGGALEVQGYRLSVALRPADGNIRLLGNKGVLYTLNGLGPRGSVVGGKASTARHQLLRREALELALYTFRYLDDVDMVVTLLPPPPPTAEETAAAAAGTAAEPPPLQAVFYRPGDLKSRLQVPLTTTVSPKTPRPETIDSGEGKIIDSLTLGNLFKASFTQAQDLTPYLVLDRPTG